LKKKEICIIGAGNGGSAIAGDMTLAGHNCRLFEFPEYAKNLSGVIEKGGIEVTGIARTGFAKVKLATTKMKEAVKGAQIIMVATQALSHERFAKEVAPYLTDGQAVILWPGSGGTIVVRKVWDEMQMNKDVVLAEGVTFPYCCRCLKGPGTVNIHRVDGPRMLVASLPATDTPRIIDALEGTYADVVKPAKSILEPAFYNVNIIVHPVGALLNMGRIEFCKGEFYMYKEGITPSVKKVIKRMDSERSDLFSKLGYKPYTYDEVFADCFNMSVEEFARTSSKGPFNMQDRYVTEDIPMGATFSVSLGQKAGVSMPTYDTMIHLASIVNDVDYFSIGRNLKNLGLADMKLDEIETYLQTGKKPKSQRAASKPPNAARAKR
jgi:opine dehydrogenase